MAFSIYPKNLGISRKTIGEYTNYTVCRFCSSTKLFAVINLGYVPLAGAFLRNKTHFKNERYYPLTASFCENCFLLQTNNVIDKDILFKDYYYYSSAIKTLVAFFESISVELKNLYKNPRDKFIIEIGCNDGAILKLLKKEGFKVLGVDPASNIVNPLRKKGLPIINNYFSENLGRKIANKYGKADAAISFNTLAHIEDMHDVIRGIKTILKKDGTLLFGVHYLGNLIKEIQYDMIYHEHQYYYSLLTLINFFSVHDMEIYNVRPINIHAGSMIYYVQNKKYGKQKVSENVIKLQKEEKKLKLHKKETYILLAKRIQKTKKDLLNLLFDLRNKNKSIIGYGASGRGTIIMNYCGLGRDILDYIVDDAPAKQDTYTPGSHFKILPSSIIKEKRMPDYILLFAWSFVDEIVKGNLSYINNGGKFIVPLPKPRII